MLNKFSSKSLDIMIEKQKAGSRAKKGEKREARDFNDAFEQARHISEVPVDFFWMPAYILFSTLVLMPIRLFGFIRCGHVGGWGTRAHAFTSDGPTAEAEVVEDSGGGSGLATAVRPVKVAAPNSTGDPRSLVPYLIATAIVILGVVYDVRPS